MSTPTLIHPLVNILREIADEQHLTQREIAEQLGVSERTVSYWFTTDTMPQKRYRRVIASWVEERTA